jgi:hypothetical protein
LSIDDYKIIWEFEHNWDNSSKELEMLRVFEDESLLDFYKDKTSWKGCFGGMSIISYDFLKSINDKYPLNKLLSYVKDRDSRMRFERVIACLMQKESPRKTLFGNIRKYCKWGVSFNERNINLPFIKVWTGR